MSRPRPRSALSTPPRRAARLLGLTCVLFGLSACVDEFPAVGPVIRGPIDAGPDVDSADARAPDGSVIAPPDDGVSDDAGALDMRPDMPPDAFVDPTLCRIGAPTRALTLRTWNDEGAAESLTLDTDCEAIEVEGSPWLRAELTGRVLRVSAPAARGVTDGVVTLTADGRAVEISVRRIGLEAGGDTRRALIYVVDGLKGETIAQSAPDAINWLAKHASKTFNAVPHDPPDGATRASGWGSLLTGLGPAAHRFEGEGAIAAPTFADRLVDQVFAAVQWDGIAAGLGVAALPRRSTINKATEALDSDAALVIVGVDGLLGATPGELESRRAQIDADLDTLLAAIARRPPEEDWLIVLTSATSGGEGPPDLPMLFAAPRLAIRALGTVTLMDVHTSVLAWLRVLRPGWDLPGEQITGGVEENCDDGADDDGDGRIDCRDADCAGACSLSCIDIELGPRTGPRVVDVTLTDFEDDLRSCANADDNGPAREASNDVTTRWIAPRTGDFVVGTVNSPFDVVFDTRVGQCGDPAPVCRDDDLGGGSPTVLSLAATEGTSYLFSVSAYEAPNGTPPVRLSIVDTEARCDAAPVVADEVRADNLDAEVSVPLQRLGIDGAELPVACQRAVANRMLRWRPAAGRWAIDVRADFPVTVSIWRQPCADLMFLNCAAPPFNVEVDGETEYLVVVSSVWDGFNYGTGAFTLELRAPEQ